MSDRVYVLSEVERRLMVAREVDRLIELGHVVRAADGELSLTEAGRMALALVAGARRRAVPEGPS